MPHSKKSIRMNVFRCGLAVLIIFQSTVLMSQNLPFATIPDYPDSLSDVSVMQRMIDGLGYRYYWASEGLTANDCAYDPGNGGQSMEQTLGHIHELSEDILGVLSGDPLVRPRQANDKSWMVKREETLNNLWQAREKLNDLNGLTQLEVVFQRGDKKWTYPIWHLINGQISDALYHTGQVVSFRRSSGNPISPNTNVFMGKSRG